MSSVTQRIKEIKQPRGGYIRPSQMKQETIDDGKVLNQEENVHATLIGLTVDYMTRVMLNNGEVFPAFDIALHGADNASIMGFFEARNILDSLLCNIKGLDDESIISACKACTFDVWYRNPDMAPLAKRYSEINPDEKTVANLRIMINRSLDFYAKYGPVIKDGLTFEPNGYTKTVSVGDGDFLTADTLWDFKVSKAEPTSKYTLQLAMYYIMGKHSGQEIYSNIHKIGIFNPRLNKIYTLDMNEVSDEVIRTIENEVICYMPYMAVDEVEELNTFYNQFVNTRPLYDEYVSNSNSIAIAKTKSVKHDELVLDIIIAIILGVCLIFTIIIPILSIIYIIWRCNTDNTSMNVIASKTYRNEQIKQIIHNEYQKTNKFVHIQYASPYILDKFMQYIRTGRCDTLKDCINLYEQEKQTAEQTRLLNNMNNKMTNIAYGIDYMAFSTLIRDIF